MISSTQLLIQSIGLPPQGDFIAKEDGCCAMCGGEYRVGDNIALFEPPDSFTEYADLQNPTGKHVCGACKAIWRKEFMQTYTKSVVCEGGLFPFFSNDAVAYWLQNPPPPPYLMAISTQQLGHLFWKVPVNFSQDLMLVRYNDKILKIRRDHLLEAVEAARLLSSLLVANEAEKAGKGKKKPKEFINPMILDRSLERSAHGSLRDDARALGKDDLAAYQAIAVLDQCTVGETWALAHVLYASPESCKKPEPKLRFGELV